MNLFSKIAGKIIKEQELIIGNLAWEEARDVNGLQVIDVVTGEVFIPEDLDQKRVIDELVNRFVVLFGRAARETCREAVITLIAELEPAQVPNTLQQ